MKTTQTNCPTSNMMKSMGKIIFATAVCLLILAAAKGQPPEQAPAADCLTYLTNVSDCTNFVEKGSTLKNPDPACCPELAGLIDSQPLCLCRMLSNSTQFDISIDLNRAIRLPSLCRIHTPDTMCTGSGSGSDNSASPTISSPSNQYFLIGAALLVIIVFTSII